MTPAPSHSEQARAALAQGDLIATYDLAQAGLASGEPDAAYLIVLSLARMGDTATAAARYVELGLDRAGDVEARALGARLAKNTAECLSGAAQQAAFAAASRLYAAVYDETGDLFPGINAASLTLLAGNAASARRRASALLQTDRPRLDYWAGVTRAEALLLLGRDADAEAACVDALKLPGGNLGARAATLRQLELLAGLAGLDPDGRVRAVLKPPGLAVYCGHMFGEHGEAEAALTARIAAALAEHDISFAFGALTCGSDIIFAEQLLARGGDLHIVLPFAVGDFVRSSVLPGGHSWGARFEACLNAAQTLHIVSEMGDIGDPGAYNHGTMTAMGLARLRAAQLGGVATMLAVYDGGPARGSAGTAVDVARWCEAGGKLALLRPGAIDRALTPAARNAAYAGPVRLPVAMIFADAPNFSKLAEADIPAFWRAVLGTAADVLSRFEASIRSRNSWGDALFVVVDSAADAAEIMLALQEALASAGAQFTLRIGGHYGMVFETDDPVTGQTTYYGTEVSRTARIEPVTPPGQAYVTASFAAALALAPAADRFRGHYVGRVPLAKDYGTLPMYRLSRAGSWQLPA